MEDGGREGRYCRRRGEAAVGGWKKGKYGRGRRKRAKNGKKKKVKKNDWEIRKGR